MATFDKVKKSKEENTNSAALRQNRSAGHENNTGIPTQLKERLEKSTGLSFNDVRVHYNSPLPARLDALAYTQGNRVEIAPGQERHLPHELGHVVHKDSMKAMKQAYLTSAARDAVSAAGSYGQLAGIVLGDVSEAFVSAQYSQSQESKADDYGFQFAVDSGRDAYSMCRALEKLSDLSGGSQASAVARMFSSHPDSAKRAAKMRAKADEYTKRK